MRHLCSMPLADRKFNPAGFARWDIISASSDAMFAIIHLLATFIADLFKPPRRLEVENLFLVRSAGRRDVGDERIVRCTAYAFAKTIEESRGDANPKPDGIFGKDNRYYE